MGYDFLKISILVAAMNICKHQLRYPSCSVDDAVRQLRNGPAHMVSYDYERAKILAQIVGWESFIIVGDRQQQLRSTLRNVIIQLKPFWAQVSYLGRNKVKGLLSEDHIQCLLYAGLLDDKPSEEVIKWWDDIGSVFRLLDQQKKLDIGRIGEKKSLELEAKRLILEGISEQPKWISIEDNSAGYDVLSYRKNNAGKLEELYIEVKTCSYSPTHFFLSVNEWEKAKNNIEKYKFHIWNLDNNDFIELNVDELFKHIPLNKGKGQWKTIEIVL